MYGGARVVYTCKMAKNCFVMHISFRWPIKWVYIPAWRLMAMHGVPPSEEKISDVLARWMVIELRAKEEANTL
jgi:hypothetical protein